MPTATWFAPTLKRAARAMRSSIGSRLASPPGSPGRPAARIELTEAHAYWALYQRRADAIWPLFGRHKLNFSHRGSPDISVIMAVRDDCADTMVSLASLRSQYRGDIDLILIDSDLAPRGEDIETYVTGATVLRFGTVLNDTAAREAGLICATAPAVLLLAAGVDLAPGAIDNALARLAGDADDRCGWRTADPAARRPAGSGWHHLAGRADPVLRAGCIAIGGGGELRSRHRLLLDVVPAGAA